MTKQKQQKQERVAGCLILRPFKRRTAAGRKISGVIARCKCGNEVEVHETILTKARRGDAQIRCATCQARDKAAHSLATYKRERTHKKDAPPIAPEPVRKDAQFPERTLQLIRRLSKRKEWLRIQEIAKGTIAGHLKAGIQPDAFTIFTDASIVAKLEAKTGQRDEAWTAQNRSEGLKIRSYCLADHAPPI